MGRDLSACTCVSAPSQRGAWQTCHVQTARCVSSRCLFDFPPWTGRGFSRLRSFFVFVCRRRNHRLLPRHPRPFICAWVSSLAFARRRVERFHCAFMACAPRRFSFNAPQQVLNNLAEQLQRLVSFSVGFAFAEFNLSEDKKYGVQKLRQRGARYEHVVTC
jgi:hypothetical protein